MVELDDASHERSAAVQSDERKAAVLSAAGIPLVRIHVRALPAAQELRSGGVQGHRRALTRKRWESFSSQPDAPSQRRTTAKNVSDTPIINSGNYLIGKGGCLPIR